MLSALAHSKTFSGLDVRIASCTNGGNIRLILQNCDPLQPHFATFAIPLATLLLDHSLTWAPSWPIITWVLAELFWIGVTRKWGNILWHSLDKWMIECHCRHPRWRGRPWKGQVDNGIIQLGVFFQEKLSATALLKIENIYVFFELQPYKSLVDYCDNMLEKFEPIWLCRLKDYNVWSEIINFFSFLWNEVRRFRVLLE